MDLNKLTKAARDAVAALKSESAQWEGEGYQGHYSDDEIKALEEALEGCPELTIRLDAGDIGEKRRDVLRLIVKNDKGKQAVAFLAVKLVRGKLSLELVAKKPGGELQRNMGAPWNDPVIGGV